MAYLGKIPATQGKDAGPALKLDDISSNFDGLTTVFDLAVDGTAVDPHVNNISVYLSGVYQIPGGSYSLSGSQIVFSAAPSASLDFHGAILGSTRIISPDNDTVETAAFTAGTRSAISGSFRTELSGSHVKLVGGGVSGSSTSLGSFGNVVSATHITASGNISASGTVFADNFESAGGNDTITFTDDLNITGSLEVQGDVTVSEYIYHKGDGDTHIRFADNLVNLVAGGKSAIKYEASTGKIIINNTNENVDFHVMAEDNSELLATDAANNRLGVNTTTPSEALDVIGNISASGNLNVGGNITGSSVSASIGKFTSVDIDGGTIIADSFTGTFDGALSSSAQIAASISGSRDAASISGSRDAASISGSLGANAGVIRTLSAATVSGSFGNQRVGTTDDVKFANITGSGNVSSSGNLSITGNVDVDGTSNFAGNVTLQNDLTVTGRIDAEEIHTTFISSSITQATGSNLFGDATTDSHQFTGSVDISGSLRVSDGNVVVSDTLTATNIGAFTAAGAIDFDNQNMTNVDIDSGNIDAVTFGSTTKSMISGSRDAASISGSFGNQRVGTTNDVKFANITGSGNISGSFTSTGSFGNVFVPNEIQFGTRAFISNQSPAIRFNLGSNYNNVAFGEPDVTVPWITIKTNEISGSSTSTGSFAEGHFIGGKVGIGMTTPTTKLQIAGNSDEEDVVLLEDNSGNDVGALRIHGNAFVIKGKHSTAPVQIQTHDGNEDIEVDPDGFIKFEAAGGEKMRISGSGWVGIGATANAAGYEVVPSAMLQIKADANHRDSASPMQLDIQGSSTTTQHFKVGYDTTLSAGVLMAATTNVSNDRIIMNPNGGNVGIGTSCPSGALHVNGANPTVYITNSTQDGASTLLRMTERKEVDGDAGGYVLFNGSSNIFQIGTNISATDTPAITLLRDGTGRVGIGTNNPGVQLEVGPTTQGSAGYGAVLASFASASNCTYSGSNSLLWGPTLSISNTTENEDINTAACLRFVHRAGSSGVAAIVSTSGYEDDRADLRFITRGAGNAISERMQLTRDGLLGIDMLDGTSYAASGTGATKGLHIKTNGVPFIRYTETNSSGGTADFEIYVANGGYTLYDLDDSATVYSVNTSQVISGDFNDTSDIGLKENIKTIDSGLSIVNKLNPVTFDWKNKKKGSNSGFIAQEVENFLPDDVSGEDFNTDYQSGRVGDVTEDEDKGFMNVGKSINLGGIVAHLTKAVQELSKKVDSQQKEIEELKS
jgi:cytoskeletal protein CcmA (bactofilin family)